MRVSWRRLRSTALVSGLTVALLGTGYLAIVASEGSRLLVHPARGIACETPEHQFGWAYEPINYDARADATGCVDLALRAGDEMVAFDGVRLAGWYVPSADGAGPRAPTVVLVHGHGSNKSGMLRHGSALHEHHNLVAFDLRNAGQSTGDRTTMGFEERADLRAVIDWLERTKGPKQIGVIGSSLGAATAILEAADDPRVDAIVIDSMHARLEFAVARRLLRNNQFVVPGTWAIFTAAEMRTGTDLADADPLDAVAAVGDRPLLITHGGGDSLDVPAQSSQLIERAAREAGVPVEVHICPGARHGKVVEVCPDEWATWVTTFFDGAW